MALGVLGLLWPSLAGAAATRVAQRLDPARLGRTPVAIRDRVVRGDSVAIRTEPPREVAPFDGRYPAGDGQDVHVVLSQAYRPDAEIPQSWASFLGTLVHGSEISQVTVFLATPETVAVACGADALACYDPGRDLLLVPAETPAEGIPLEEIAAHEYGHVVANHRSNFPFPAVQTGTKRWATYEGVCQRLLRAVTSPAPIPYARDPGEAFADSYRVLNGGSRELWRFDRSFFPNATDLAAIRTDVLSPWRQAPPYAMAGTFRSTAPRGWVRRFGIATPLDGLLRLRITAPTATKLESSLLDRRLRRSLAFTSRRGRSGIDTLICGTRSYVLTVRRKAGFGSFRVTVSRP